MNRKQRIDKILSNKFDNFLLEIVDNSNLHKGHNNFTGSGETHIKIILTKKDRTPSNRLRIHRIINSFFNKFLFKVLIIRGIIKVKIYNDSNLIT